MKIVKRTILKKVKEKLFKRKIIIIYGARQVGKTTLIKEIQKNYSGNCVFFNCDEPDIRDRLTNKTSTELKAFIGNNKLVLIDEAQRVENVGITLKLLNDNFPDIQVIATGSSSFDLSNKVSEPLTGRKYVFNLYPFSYQELSSLYSKIEWNRLLEERIIYGMYPEIIFEKKEAKELVTSNVESYLYKDILQHQNIRNPEVLRKLLQALALQIGNQVSFNELSQTIGVDKGTVSSYIDILEKAFVIFRLQPFARNLRTELKKLRKIYFWDAGMRNALINNFNHFDLRQDVGALWENFVISERVKYLNNHGFNKNIYFWRTHAKEEIDYLEEEGGKLGAFEIKFSKDRMRKPKAFTDNYPEAEIALVNKENFQKFVS